MKMNKSIKTILILSIAVFGIGFLWVNPILADDTGLEVQFQNGDDQPLFNEANFLPGDSIPRWVKVTNSSGEDQEIGVNVTGHSDCSETYCLSDELNLVISKDGNALYTGSLTDFYGAGEIYLSSLPNGSTNQYDFFITFAHETGNDYQSLGTSFNFEIGFWGESISAEILPGSGGGGGVFIAGLQISDEIVVNVGTNSVTIIWDTNKKSTSRVIYSPSDESYVFDWTNPPNYGYSHSTLEHDTPANLHGVTVNHTVHITDLSEGTTYYYRCVSHASPDTVSTEHSFTTKGIAGTETEEDKEGPGEMAGEWTGPGESIPAVGEVEPIVKGTTTEEKEEPITILTPEVISGFVPNLLADIGNIFGGLGSTCYPCFPWWVILILGICLLIESALSKKRERRRAKKWLIWSLVLIALSIILYLTNYHCVAIWIYLALALSTLLFWRFVNSRGTKNPFIVGLFIILILFIIWLIIKCLYIWIILIAILIYLFIVNSFKEKQL